MTCRDCQDAETLESTPRDYILITVKVVNTGENPMRLHKVLVYAVHTMRDSRIKR